MKKNREEYLETTSKLYEKGLPLYIDQRVPEGYPAGRGINRIYTQGQKSFVAHAQGLTEAQKLWLGELLLSPNIFIEVPNFEGETSPTRYKPVYIEDLKAKIWDSADDNDDFKGEFYYSNLEFSQRN